MEASEKVCQPFLFLDRGVIENVDFCFEYQGVNFRFKILRNPKAPPKADGLLALGGALCLFPTF